MPADRRLSLKSPLALLLLTGGFLASCALSGRGIAAEAGWIADPASHCHLWNPAPKPDDSVTWTGACPDGIAEGRGTALWYGADKSKIAARDSGTFRHGRLDGPGLRLTANGLRLSGYWVEGRLSGRAHRAGKANFRTVALSLSEIDRFRK